MQMKHEAHAYIDQSTLIIEVNKSSATIGSAKKRHDHDPVHGLDEKRLTVERFAPVQGIFRRKVSSVMYPCSRQS
jgi:hypothetical protein